MPQISFLRPIDQPTNQRRFLNELEACMGNPNFSEFYFAVAYAKVGPFVRLEEHFKRWKETGKYIRAILGIDQIGTSKQALEFALRYFSEVYITHVDASQSTRVTFHPKQYIFAGENEAVCYVGSHNMTTGGTETNFEAGIKIEMSLPEDEAIYQDALESWNSLLPNSDVSTLKLDKLLLEQLNERGLLLDEKQSTKINATRVQTALRPAVERLFPKQIIRPARPLPPKIFQQTGIQQSTQITESFAAAQIFIIQIVPHDNGEVFLSYSAVKQNPSFFGYPFTGQTQPKRAGNNPYPQRLPDPIVNIFAYDQNDEIVLSKHNFNLNTVDYEVKSEIRITFSPDLVHVMPEYTIMIMEKGEDAAIDYIIRTYVPGSRQFNSYLAACNQTLPSGGKPIPRKMGWL